MLANMRTNLVGMTRMLGRTNVRGLSLNCATRDGRFCRDCGWDGRMGTRAAKRLEERELAADIADELHPQPGLDHRAALGLLYDFSDCEHGCNGDSPCGDEQCTFICHPGSLGLSRDPRRSRAVFRGRRGPVRCLRRARRRDEGADRPR